jgi:hypothetical protein
MKPLSNTPETIRRKARRLLDAARDATDHEKKGKLLGEALTLAQLAAVMEYERTKASQKF